MQIFNYTFLKTPPIGGVVPNQTKIIFQWEVPTTLEIGSSSYEKFRVIDTLRNLLPFFLLILFPCLNPLTPPPPPLWFGFGGCCHLFRTTPSHHHHPRTTWNHFRFFLLQQLAQKCVREWRVNNCSLLVKWARNELVGEIDLFFASFIFPPIHLHTFSTATLRGFLRMGVGIWNIYLNNQP